METNQLNTTLNGLIGHLAIDTPEEQKKFTQLSKSLSKSSLKENICEPVKPGFSFEKSDLFFEERILEIRKKNINSIVNKNVKGKEEPQYRVFRREVPVREQLLHNSIAEWAVGAKVDHSIGPFNQKDGRQFWFDFFPIEKLIALYMQGETDPVLLFKIKPGRQLAVNPDLPITANPSKTYNLLKGSIWISSKFLAPNAPSGTYTGLTINSGKIQLSDKPQKVNDKLTVSSNTTITVQLNLDQPEVADPDDESPYGIDAREMQLQLPETLEFHFSGNGRSIDNVSQSGWNLYGQAIEFDWSESAQTTYDTQIQRIVFPFQASEQNVEIQKNESDFNFLSEEAEIDRSGWVLPVASIDISQPVAAGGIGEMFVQCKKGLLDGWHGLKGGGFSLNAPGLLVAPGQILLADLSAGNSHASQSLELWKDELNKFGTKVELTFSNQTTFFYASNANGNELLMTFTNADFEIDRPVRVNCEPPPVRSLNSLLLIAVNKTNRLIYLV